MDIDNVYENYVHTRKLDLNLIKIKNSSNKMYDFIRNVFTDNGKGCNGQTSMTEQIFSKYNLFLYPFAEFYELYFNIREMFYDKLEVENHEESYYIQSWLNFYWKGDFIDWHGHWPSYAYAWHGYYCVDVEPSKTSYKLENSKKIIDIKNENNLLVLSKSLNDNHRTWPWEYEHPRITIAFDIVPASTILNYQGENKMGINHWMPI
jgi:hypothetical protein